MLPTENYVRKASMLRVIDGDTVELRVDLGCDINLNMTCRLNGINAPEKNTPEGIKAKIWLQAALPENLPVIVQTTKDKKEKFGRYLAVIYLNNEPMSINDVLVTKGFAVPYHGEARPVAVKVPVVKKVAVKKPAVKKV